MGNVCECLDENNIKTDIICDGGKSSKHSKSRKKYYLNTDGDEGKELINNLNINQEMNAYKSKAKNTFGSNDSVIEYNQEIDDYSRKSSISCKFFNLAINDNESLSNSVFELLNQLKLYPNKIIKEIEQIFTDNTFVYNPINKDENEKIVRLNKKTSYENDASNLISSFEIKDLTAIEDNTNDETVISIKEIRYKEIKAKLNELTNLNKLVNNAILKSEKLHIFASELITCSYTSRVSEEVTDYLKHKFDDKYNFKEINWIGYENSFYSITSFVFASLKNLEIILSNNFAFGSLHTWKSPQNEIEFSLFLAIKNK